MKIKSYGFTIVELLVVIVVIGILAAITIISFTGISSKANTASLQADLSNASKLLKIDQVLNSTYPTTLAAANNGKGININSDTTPQYIVNNSISPPGFCITTTKGSTTYRITETGTPTIGNCDSFGLVLSLDAGNASSYPSPFNGTTWTDLSGLGNNGTLYNGVGYNGADGGSLSFDGVNDYVQTPISGTYQTLSIVFWSYFDDVTLNTKSRDESAFGDWNSNHIHFGTRWSVGMHWNVNGQWSEVPNTNLVSGWNHYTLTYDTKTNQKLVYINNILSLSTPTSNPIIINDFKIGEATVLGKFYRGKISDFNIYNRALSSTEITNNFNSTKARYGL